MTPEERAENIRWCPAPPESGRTDGKRTRSPEPTPEARAMLAEARAGTRMDLRLQYSGAADAWSVEGRYRTAPGRYHLMRDGSFVDIFSGKVAIR